VKSIEEQLARYKSVHLNQKNINTHFVGVPLIVLAVTLLLSTVIFDIIKINLFDRVFSVQVTLAMIIFAGVACLYNN